MHIVVLPYQLVNKTGWVVNFASGKSAVVPLRREWREAQLASPLAMNEAKNNSSLGTMQIHGWDITIVSSLSKTCFCSCSCDSDSNTKCRDLGSVHCRTVIAQMDILIYNSNSTQSWLTYRIGSINSNNSGSVATCSCSLWVADKTRNWGSLDPNWMVIAWEVSIASFRLT